MLSSSYELDPDTESTSTSKSFDFEEEYEKIVVPIVTSSMENLTLSETESLENRTHSEEIQRLRDLVRQLRKSHDKQEEETFDLYTEITLLKDKGSTCDAKLRDYQHIKCQNQKIELENEELKNQLREERKLSIGAFQSIISEIEELGPTIKISKFRGAIKKSLRGKIVEVEKRKEINMEKIRQKENLQTENYDLKMEVERLKKQLMEEKTQSVVLHKSLIADLEEKLAQDPRALQYELHEREVSYLNEQIEIYKLEIEKLQEEIEDQEDQKEEYDPDNGPEQEPLLPVRKDINWWENDEKKEIEKEEKQDPKKKSQKEKCLLKQKKIARKEYDPDNKRRKTRKTEEPKPPLPSQKDTNWWEIDEKEVITVPDPFRISKPPLSSETPRETIQILKLKLVQQTKELEFANKQIAMIIENSDLLRAKEASEHAQEMTWLKDQIEELNKTICYLSQQLSGKN